MFAFGNDVKLSFLVGGSLSRERFSFRWICSQMPGPANATSLLLLCFFAAGAPELHSADAWPSEREASFEILVRRSSN